MTWEHTYTKLRATITVSTNCESASVGNDYSDDHGKDGDGNDAGDDEDVNGDGDHQNSEAEDDDADVEGFGINELRSMWSKPSGRDYCEY